MEDTNTKLDALLSSVQELHAKLDAMAGGSLAVPAVAITPSNKGMTLPELARKATLGNGQERITAIVGYYEKLQGRNEILIADLQQGWKDGKFSGAYASVYLHRALKEGLVRQRAKGAYDLTQTGEDFFAKLFETSN